MPRPSRPIGSRFGRLTLIGRPGPNKWLVRCDCGVSKVVDGGNVASGKTKSCGCLQSESARINGRVTKTHGLTRSSTYSSWVSMKQRCLTPTHPAYPKYGGRGVSVCKRWAASFNDFLADMGPRPPGTSLDRFPNGDGNYEPGNCRWATRSNNSRNRRSCIWVMFEGKRRLLIELCEQFGVRSDTIRRRLKCGETADEAFANPIRAKRPNGELAAELAKRVIVLPRISAEKQQDVVRLFESGRTYDQIVAAVGVSYNSVGRIIKRAGAKR